MKEKNQFKIIYLTILIIFWIYILNDIRFIVAINKLLKWVLLNDIQELTRMCLLSDIEDFLQIARLAATQKKEVKICLNFSL